MAKVIVDGAIVDNQWQRLDNDTLESGLPEGKVLVPLAYWQENRDNLLARGDVAVWLAPGEEPRDLEDDLEQFTLIAIHFPAFKDGRGYSYARELRTRYNFKGEIRATGDVLRDQLFYLQRCGFNAFEVRTDRCIEDALAGLRDFSVTYQGDAADPRPIYRRA
ncbi:DUF934 domain-containing protein [Alcanivorax sp. S6407]|uniref:DUF934 domain-containing protein n=1 Tax=Alcanivorax sp. S6407 TaxID=2926424 RepID=UPI001FF36B3B|nr:DUF934 domain-containing protein [Alcanivorax sp. S6407]MCK0152606.1 DUF934 domain-containing protein [Alcanivorax sp. S6407]